MLQRPSIQIGTQWLLNTSGMELNRRNEILKQVLRARRFYETGEISSKKAVGFEDRPTYGRYNGSYAQDVDGWSDQDIDDVFDGNPDAYWNID